MKHEITFYLNGIKKTVTGAQAGMMLADYLRQECMLTGTKIVCAEGDCGACTVLRFNPLDPAQALIPVNSCVAPVASMHGSAIVSVDALAAGPVVAENAAEVLHPVQKAMMDCHGSQCGFCTPGFVMAVSGLVEKNLCEKKRGAIKREEAKNALTGNLCRCTGYEAILEAVEKIDVKKCEPLQKRYISAAQLQDLKKIAKDSVFMESNTFTFYAPTDLKSAVKYLQKNADAKILAGATDLGVVHNKYKSRLKKVMSLQLISELYKISANAKMVEVGARASLSQLRDAVKNSIPEFARFLDIFASPQIKNVATLVGNLVNASPIGDTLPFLLVSQAEVLVLGPKGKRNIPIEKFFLDYRKTALKKSEIVTAVRFTVPQAQESLGLFKISQRKDLDISAVNAAFRVNWADAKKTKIKAVAIAFGGVAATPVRLTKAEKFLQGKALSLDVIQQAIAIIQKSLKPLDDLRGSSVFRRVLIESLVLRFFSEHSGALQKKELHQALEVSV